MDALVNRAEVPLARRPQRDDTVRKWWLGLREQDANENTEGTGLGFSTNGSPCLAIDATSDTMRTSPTPRLRP